MDTRERERLEKLLKQLRNGVHKSQYEILSAERLVALLKNNTETDKEKALIQSCETYIQKIKDSWKPQKNNPKTFEERYIPGADDEFLENFRIKPVKK